MKKNLIPLVIIGSMAFIDPATKIAWTIFVAVPLIILTGSAGVVIITKRFEAIIGGAIIAALLPAFGDIITTARLSLLP